jgi:hypothetical protein
MRARFVVAILSLALVYAATCSATCAICLSPGAGLAAETQGHSCEHAAGGSHQQAPAKPDCLGRHHSSFDVRESGGLSWVQLSATGLATQLFHGAVRVGVVNLGASFFSDLAPPRDVAIFPQQNNSILRI